MQFELNEIEARREQYPSTISFLNLINTLIAEEKDLSDRGQRYWSLYLSDVCWCHWFLFEVFTLSHCCSLNYFPDLLASLGSSMIMFLGHFLKELMQIPVRNGSWLVLALNISTCEWFQFLLS